jgi:hypothetical protein
MLNSKLAIALLPVSMVATAADRWISAGPETPAASAPLVNIGHVVVNGEGNRVATIRSYVNGYQLEILTEFDCTARRTRALASALTDKTGRLVNASGPQKVWFDESKSLGLTAVCEASPSTP